jgi:hypothetical protein
VARRKGEGRADTDAVDGQLHDRQARTVSDSHRRQVT